LPDDHFIKRNENVFAFSLSTASFEMLHFLLMLLAPFGVSNAGAQMYHFVPGLLDKPNFDPCNAACPYSSLLLARGENSGIVVTGRHSVAERCRADRARRQQKLTRRLRMIDWLQDNLDRLASKLEGAPDSEHPV
jgi:hypothetical protein